MGKFVLAVAILALYIYAMLDLVRAPSAEVRLLPKWLWAIVVLFIFLIGPVMWLALGRPRAEYPPGGGEAVVVARVGGARDPVAQSRRTMTPSSSSGSMSSHGRSGWSDCDASVTVARLRPAARDPLLGSRRIAAGSRSAPRVIAARPPPSGRRAGADLRCTT